MAGSREHTNGTACCINFVEFIDQVNDYQLLSFCSME